jgi:formate dehydrogenase alpha subunit
MDKVTLTIDGQEITANKGMTVLEAALENDIYIPHLCYHPDLEPAGVCRLCMVEIGGSKGQSPIVTTSCNTPAAEGMVVKTDTPEVNKIRRTAVELIIVNHVGDCLQCAKNTECELQKVASYIGIDEKRLQRLRRTTRTLPVDTSNPFFDYDPNKCILCGVCVRTCEQLQGVKAIDFAFRGYSTIISTFGNVPRAESICESCGECVVRCPVGALTPKKSQRPSREVRTICTYCGCGCGMYLGVRGDEIVSVRGDDDSPINNGSLCAKGRFGYEFINSPERLTSPLIKHNGEFLETTWDDALDFVAGNLADYKGDQFAAISSAKCTNEENYLAQKFTRGVMGTNNIDHCARL